MEMSRIKQSLNEINKAWEKHDEAGVVRLTMAQTSMIAGVLEELVKEGPFGVVEVKPEYQSN